MEPMRDAAASGERFRTALVLGGGGMFGAYQAGVWRALHGSFRPDVVIGASIGAINAWAIAGGCDPEQWVDQWLDFREAAAHRFRFHRMFFDGCIDRQGFEDFIRRHHARFVPRLPCAVAVTYVRGLEPGLVLSPNISWAHLAASCAVPFMLPAYRLERGLAVDGGLMSAVPLWAASQLGVERTVAVNLLPRAAPWWLRGGRALLHRASRFTMPDRSGMEVEWIEHPTPLGSIRESARWDARRAARLVESGRRDAELALPRIEAWGAEDGHKQVDSFLF